MSKDSPIPRYQAGQLVRFRPRAGNWLPVRGKIVRVLPHGHGPFQYRIKSEEEAYERIVEEGRIEQQADGEAESVFR